MDITRIVLDVQQDKDVALLLALLERLNIKVVQKTAGKEHVSEEKDHSFILKGLPARKDSDVFVAEFEESRKDRPFPNM